MTSYVALLRGINVGGNKMVAMAALRAMLEELGFEDAETLLQSGNAVFRAQSKSAAALERQLEAETQRRLGVAAEYHVRTAKELHAVIAANPLPAQAASDPSHFVVIFHKAPIAAAAVRAAQAAISGPEILRADGRHLYMFFPEGMGRSKAPAEVGKVLRVHGTARNWNTVRKLADLAGS